MLNYSRDKNEGTYRSGEGAEEPALCPRISVTSRKGERRSKKTCEDNRWDGQCTLNVYTLFVVNLTYICICLFIYHVVTRNWLESLHPLLATPQMAGQGDRTGEGVQNYLFCLCVA